MRDFAPEELATLSEAFAFIGNSLLKPVNQTPKVGLDPAFWAEFPDFGDAGVAQAVTACRAFAEAGSADGDAFETRVATEYARLFIGPPKPAAAPWESAYRGSGGTGFGQATFEMRSLLREAGLEMAGENNQYADHMGIELLLLSVLLQRAAAGEGEAAEAAAFAAAHPASWIAPLQQKVQAGAPEGYLCHLLALADGLLRLLVEP
ncbi:MAG: molecular chaperone TorD [Coriobacteriaceae bacterium]|nr:molecular chaperone TorD [Coriobacteriaceae bacterium]